MSVRWAIRTLTLLAALPFLLGAAPGPRGAGSPAPYPAPAHRRAVRPQASRPLAPLLKPLGQLALDARLREESGEYAIAADRLRELRGRVALDADLELSLALDELRSGQADSARARLDGPTLSAALADTAGVSRRHEYPFERETLWRNGKFDGWYWYVARARAELALLEGRWRDARRDALIAAQAKPFAGKEWLLLAITSAHCGDLAEAAEACERATRLDPTLPEAHHLQGLLLWRTGARAGARAQFEAAIEADSSFRLSALALLHLQLPGARPDTLPHGFLTGARRVVMLSSPERPKFEEAPHYDQPAAIYEEPSIVLADSTKRAMHLTAPLHIYVTVLVDEQGRAVVNELPYLPPGGFPEALVGQIAQLTRTWSFRPGVKLGHNIRSWATLELPLNP